MNGQIRIYFFIVFALAFSFIFSFGIFSKTANADASPTLIMVESTSTISHNIIIKKYDNNNIVKSKTVKVAKKTEIKNTAKPVKTIKVAKQTKKPTVKKSKTKKVVKKSRILSSPLIDPNNPPGGKQ